MVRDNAERSRYELVVDGKVLGIADYHRVGDAIVIPHSEIDAAHRGQGLGDVLVRGALDDIRRQGLHVVAHCWFVADFISRHAEFNDLVSTTG